MAQMFRIDATDLPSRRRSSEERTHHPAHPPARSFGDKLQLLALLHPASLRVLEEMVDDTIERLKGEGL